MLKAKIIITNKSINESTNEIVDQYANNRMAHGSTAS